MLENSQYCHLFKYADSDSSTRTPSPPPCHVPPPIMIDRYATSEQRTRQLFNEEDSTPTNIICWCRLCRGSIRRPSDIVREHELTNGLHRNAPPSSTRGDQPMVFSKL